MAKNPIKATTSIEPNALLLDAADGTESSTCALVFFLEKNVVLLMGIELKFLNTFQLTILTLVRKEEHLLKTITYVTKHSNFTIKVIHVVY